MTYDPADTAATRIAQALTGERDLLDKVDAIVGAWLFDRRCLTRWEREFILPIAERAERTGALRLTLKQREAVARIHDKIKDRLVI